MKDSNFCSFLLLLATVGCSTNKIVWKGDGIKLTQHTPGWIATHFGGWGVPAEVVTLKFPSVDLRQESTNIYRVRDFPTNFPIRFALEMPKATWSWDVKPKIRIGAQRDGTELCNFDLTLPDPTGAVNGLQLPQLDKLQTVENYDLTLVVQRPSTRKAKIRIKGKTVRSPEQTK
jgi:hypothetical protein